MLLNFKDKTLNFTLAKNSTYTVFPASYSEIHTNLHHQQLNFTLLNCASYTSIIWVMTANLLIFMIVIIDHQLIYMAFIDYPYNVCVCVCVCGWGGGDIKMKLKLLGTFSSKWHRLIMIYINHGAKESHRCPVLCTASTNTCIGTSTLA